MEKNKTPKLWCDTTRDSPTGPHRLRQAVAPGRDITLYVGILYHSMLCYIIVYHIILQYIVLLKLYYIISYCILLYSIQLYYITGRVQGGEGGEGWHGTYRCL